MRQRMDISLVMHWHTHQQEGEKKKKKNTIQLHSTITILLQPTHNWASLNASELKYYSTTNEEMTVYKILMNYRRDI